MLIPTSPNDNAINFFIVRLSPKKKMAKHIAAIGVIELIDVARPTGMCLIAYIQASIATIFVMLLAVCVLFGTKRFGKCL